MKKVLILLLFIFMSANTVFAQNNISFIYINGSNTNNKKMTNWFLDGVKKTQKDMVKAFNSSDFIKKEFLNNNTRKINQEAIPFYWGDMSQAEIEALKDDLQTGVSKIFTPHLAQSVRAFMAYCLHDAIWVTKDYNMSPILKRLHKVVMDEYAKGNSVVLFGYSAGSFITAQYLASKTPYINPAILFKNSSLSGTEKKYVDQVSVKNTCIDALVASKLVVMSNERDLIPNNNPTLFKKNYAQLDKYTQLECIPTGAVDGIVNFASPLSLFYSDISTAYFKSNILNAYLLRFIIENNQFFLTVNYAEDPMSFPTTENPRLEQFEAYFGKEIKANKGFIYDKSDAKTSRTFLNAHISYWATSKKFSKAVVQGYEEGYRHFYENSASQSLIKQSIINTEQISKRYATDPITAKGYSFGNTVSEE